MTEKLLAVIFVFINSVITATGYGGIVLLMAANWIVAYNGCSVRNPNGCDYNERYELMRKHPELVGMHKDATGNWVWFDTTTTR